MFKNVCRTSPNNACFPVFLDLTRFNSSDSLEKIFLTWKRLKTKVAQVTLFLFFYFVLFSLHCNRGRGNQWFLLLFPQRTCGFLLTPGQHRMSKLQLGTGIFPYGWSPRQRCMSMGGGKHPLIFSQLSDFWWLVIGDWWLVIHTKKGFYLFFGDWWFTFFGFSVSITNCKSPEKKVGSLLTLIISNCQSPKMFCLFFTVNSHLSIANFFII